jgi:hypothetical protein
MSSFQRERKSALGRGNTTRLIPSWTSCAITKKRWSQLVKACTSFTVQAGISQQFSSRNMQSHQKIEVIKSWIYVDEERTMPTPKNGLSACIRWQ